MSKKAKIKTPFHDHWVALSPDEKEELVDNTGLSLSCLSQYAHGHRKPEIVNSTRIVMATDGKITLFDLRPDLEAQSNVRKQK